MFSQMRPVTEENPTELFEITARDNGDRGWNLQELLKL